jgi:hypothetical protein
MDRIFASAVQIWKMLWGKSLSRRERVRHQAMGGRARGTKTTLKKYLWYPSPGPLGDGFAQNPPQEVHRASRHRRTT